MTSSLPVKPMDVNEEIRTYKRDEFLNYLLTTSMSPELHIPCYGTVMSVRSDENIPTVMRRLSVEGFTSAPVLAPGGAYVGFIDMLDLVKFVTNMFFGVTSEAWVDFWDREVRFEGATVADVMEKKSTQMGLYPEPLFEDNSTMHALEVMATGGLHRLAILNDRVHRGLVGIFTQSMLISELTQRLFQLGDLRYKTVGQMTFASKSVATVRETEKAINAFNVMAQQNLSGLAVVDMDGILVNAISITDLKCVGVNGEFFSRLFKPIKEYKKLMAENFPIVAPKSHYSKKPMPMRGLYVTPNNTFEDVIRLMADGNLHRVFVCSASSSVQGRPVPLYVITQTDILRIIWQHYTFSLTLV